MKTHECLQPRALGLPGPCLSQVMAAEFFLGLSVIIKLLILINVICKLSMAISVIADQMKLAK